MPYIFACAGAGVLRQMQTLPLAIPPPPPPPPPPLPTAAGAGAGAEPGAGAGERAVAGDSAQESCWTTGETTSYAPCLPALAAGGPEEGTQYTNERLGPQYSQEGNKGLGSQYSQEGQEGLGSLPDPVVSPLGASSFPSPPTSLPATTIGHSGGGNSGGGSGGGSSGGSGRRRSRAVSVGSGGGIPVRPSMPSFSDLQVRPPERPWQAPIQAHQPPLLRPAGTPAWTVCARLLSRRANPPPAPSSFTDSQAAGQELGQGQEQGHDVPGPWPGVRQMQGQGQGQGPDSLPEADFHGFSLQHALSLSNMQVRSCPI